jgi:hypothetical protein
MKKYLTKGIAIGIAYENRILQFAIVKLLIELDFNILIAGLKRFRECLRD